ncbi:TadE/TadG family type IV pilus assembly protein [Pseudogemmobacter sonorensis]|uniref:TadE/TadG family type IV pilus assembly protein n=1 Tax=Pseudogemmobacter sonorensis TaxID=2989681 RepID=UPI0036CDBA86
MSRPNPVSRLLSHLRHRAQRLWRREDGTATIEFVFCVPVVLTLFMASMESGYYMIRHVMMDRGLDLVIRDYRLGRLQSVSHDDLRKLVCEATPVILNCESAMRVWIQPINTTSWARPGTNAFCGDRNGTLTAPSTGSVQHGASNQIMFVRICMIQKPLFPTTGLGLQLRADSVSGGYQLAVTTVVVNEPVNTSGN